MGALLAGCFVWLIIRIVDRGFDHAVNQVRLQSRGRESILIEIQRLTHLTAGGYWFSWMSISLLSIHLSPPRPKGTVAGTCGLRSGTHRYGKCRN